MTKQLNYWSFVLSTIWVLLFFVISSTGPNVYTIFGLHPHVLLLVASLLTLLIGLIGLSGMKDWKSAARSFSTIFLTLGLSAFLAFIIFFGKLASQWIQAQVRSPDNKIYQPFSYQFTHYSFSPSKNSFNLYSASCISNLFLITNFSQMYTDISFHLPQNGYNNQQSP